MKPNPDAAPPAPRKPRLALAIATCLGLGCIPFGPGTWGSLLGVALSVISGACWFLLGWIFAIAVLHRSVFEALNGIGFEAPMIGGHPVPLLLFLPPILTLIVVGLVGIWSAGRVARFAGKKDPQLVVIDEVSGQHLALLLGLAPSLSPAAGTEHPGLAAYVFFGLRLLNWKYLLLGFILFRVFDIWKPFPVRQAEKLPGGWGIMADDWVAAIYAALGLWVARYLGL